MSSLKSQIRICKVCGSSSDEVAWVTKRQVNNGLLCKNCSNISSAARKIVRRSCTDLRIADNLKSAEYMRRMRKTEEGLAKLNAANAATMRVWRKKQPGKNLANTRAYILAKIQRVPKWANTSAIKQFYINCPIGYEVDHVIPLRGKLVSGLHCETNLQYLLKAENASKGSSFDPLTFIGP